jgi:two-component system OmpR family sensor kinase
MNSIRRHLLFWQIGALIITGILASLITYSLAWDGFNRLRDYGLEQIAYSIVRHGVATDDENADNGEIDPADRGQFVSQIWNADGSLEFSSLENIGPPPQRPGMHRLTWQGEEWHLYTLNDGGLTIQVGNPITHRVRIFSDIAPWLLLPLSLLIVSLGSLIWVSVSRGLAPLEQVRAEIGRRDAGSLEPLDVSRLPVELAPVIGTLNDLLARLAAALAAQGRFVADAAHELRTPLTAVRLQAQLAAQADDDAGRQSSIASLLAGVDRAGHLIEQLLQLARLDPLAWNGQIEPVAVDEMARQVVAALSAQADARRIDLGIGECRPATLPGHGPSLHAMLANLVDNALRYIPEGGRVDVEVKDDGHDILLSVDDDGPGIPGTERDRVFDRFSRGAGVALPGSGLGLAIAKRAVEMHGGTILLDESPAGGLRVRVTLPKRGPPT